MDKIDKILEETSAKQEIVDRGRKFKGLRDKVEFCNVSFRFPDREQYAIKNVNLSIPAGKLIMVVGRSGSGKTTLIDLMTGILEPSEGEVKFDGIPLSKYELSSIRRKIAVVTQDTFLFNERIIDNLCYGVAHSKRENTSKALEFVDLKGFVDSLSSGVETFIEDDGRKLSGGQKQRLSIARAIVKDAPIIILDEPTSALDTQSEKIVVENIQKMVNHLGKTVIIITHRMSMQNKADYLISLRDGVIVKKNAGENLTKNNS